MGETFFCLEEQVVLSKLLEDLRKVEAMFGQTLGEHQNTIYVNQYEAMNSQDTSCM